MFVGLVILLVLIGLCVALGAVYAYIYFTRINPSRSRKHLASHSNDLALPSNDLASHSNADCSPSATADDSATAATHLFLFRKSTN